MLCLNSPVKEMMPFEYTFALPSMESFTYVHSNLRTLFSSRRIAFPFFIPFSNTHFITS